MSYKTENNFLQKITIILMNNKMLTCGQVLILTSSTNPKNENYSKNILGEKTIKVKNYKWKGLNRPKKFSYFIIHE